jgi:uncharacterized protein
MTSSGLPPLIQSMMQPEFYPHPVQEPIQLLQTHISYVFLTGDFAYKVKKPVNFGFLDFSTLEQRQHFCAEELRLNQRAASELYLDVLPITQSGETFLLGNSGETVEYTLKMRQFPQDGLFLALFEQGLLTEQDMERFADELAKFHAKAQTSNYIDRFGEVAQVRLSVDENYQQTEKYIGGPQTQAQYEATKHYTDQFFAEHADIFAQRVQDHFIRECHGDVHLRNVCRWNQKILLFDCIEFNEPFRFVDVMYDVAFAVMDIEARNRSDLANTFLNSYVEQTGDWEGLQVLPLYLSRQAYVRAKVGSFILDDPNIPESVRQESSAAAAEYYKLAWNYTQPTPGQIVLMAGLSGAGKSTTARNLARRCRAIHLRSDAVRKHLANIPLNQKGGDELYTPDMNQKTYDRLLNLGILLAQQGFTVILDAKYDRQALRASAINQAQAHQIPLKILHCIAPLETLQKRLEQRMGDIADATTDVLAQQSFEDFTHTEQAFVQTINTTQDVVAQLNAFC